MHEKTYDLYTFIKKSQGIIIRGKGKKITPIPGFMGYEYGEGVRRFTYVRAGYFKLHLIATVFEQDEPVFMYHLNGKIEEGMEEFARPAYQMLNKIVVADEQGYISFRGPHQVNLGKWTYTYTQDGLLEQFYGHEALVYENKTIVNNTVMGGMIRKL